MAGGRPRAVVGRRRSIATGTRTLRDRRVSSHLPENQEQHLLSAAPAGSSRRRRELEIVDEEEPDEHGDPDLDPIDEPQVAEYEEVEDMLSDLLPAAEADPADDDEEEAGQMDGREAWNTPLGYVNTKRQVDAFVASLREHGHVCAVCGERKFDTRPVAAHDLAKWQIDGDWRTGLTTKLYAQYPSKTVEQANSYPVCHRCAIEGLPRQRRVEAAAKDEKRVKLMPMKYSRANTGMVFRYRGTDPLVKLDLVNESMISLISSVITIKKVIGGQSKAIGNTSFFMNWSGVQQAAVRLPRRVEEAKIVIRYPPKNVEGRERLREIVGHRIVSLQVNPDLIRECLHWLIEERRNDLYRAVELDEEAMQSLRDAHEAARVMTLDEAMSGLDNMDERYTTSLNVDPVQPNEVQQALAENVGPTVIERRGQPCRPHETPTLLAQSFPSLFPDGRNSDYRNYKIPLTTTEMVAHCVRFGDPRFSQHYRFVATMVNVKDLELAYSQIGAVLNGRVRRRARDGTYEDATDNVLREMTRPDLTDNRQLREMLNRNNIMFAKMRGTAPFWEREKKRMVCTVGKLGAPNAFVTFSSADTYWPDLEAFLKSYEETDNSVMPEDDEDPMDAEDQEGQYAGEARDRARQRMLERRQALLNKNQVLAGWWFVRRLDAFMKHIVRYQPLLCGKLTDYIIRYETQGRGSLHAHMLWWIDIDEEYIREQDRVGIPNDLLQAYHLIELDQEGNPVIDGTGHPVVVYDQTKLDYTNANIWGLSGLNNVHQKLDIGVTMERVREHGLIDNGEEEYRINTEHPATIDPSSVSDECLAVRIARCASVLQKHVCGDACLVRKHTGEKRASRRKPGALPQGLRLELMECRKRFPRPVPERNNPPKAHVVKDYSGIVRYNGPRDDGYVNACHPIFAHAWGANTDMQILHGKGSSFAVTAYLTTYISKFDQFGHVGWREVMYELKDQLELAVDINRGETDREDRLFRSYYQEVYKAIRKLTGDREISMQECTLEAFGLPYTRYTRDAVSVQVADPRETRHVLKKRWMVHELRQQGQRLVFEDLVYATHVRKYVNRPVGSVDFDGTVVDMDKVCMYEFFSRFMYKPRKNGGKQLVLRRKESVIMPTPYIKASKENERWCYQVLMLFTPFRNHLEVMFHPADRNLTEPVNISYEDGLPIFEQDVVGADARRTSPAVVDDTLPVEESGPRSQPDLGLGLTLELQLGAADGNSCVGPGTNAGCSGAEVQREGDSSSELAGADDPSLALTDEGIAWSLRPPVSAPAPTHGSTLAYGRASCSVCGCEAGPAPTAVSASARDSAPGDAGPDLVVDLEFACGDHCESNSEDISGSRINSFSPSGYVRLNSGAGAEVGSYLSPGEREVSTGDCCGVAVQSTLSVAASGPGGRPKPYVSARQLLRQVLDEKLISDMYLKTKDALEVLALAVEADMQAAATMPTPEEIRAAMRDMGLDETNADVVEELTNKIALDYNMRHDRNVVNEDHVEQMMFCGPSYLTDVREFTGRASASRGTSTRQHVTNETDATRRPSTVEERLLRLEEVRQEIAHKNGVYFSIRFRQALVLNLVLDAIEDLIRSETNTDGAPTIRTCRLVLQGEAGTGKTYVLQRVVELLCLFLGASAVKVCAPTANAAKIYQDSACGATTFHHLWRKGWGADSDFDGKERRVESNLADNAKTQWETEMKTVKAIICDEISMLSPTDVELMSRRMGEARGGAIDVGDFAGVPVAILCGDLYQLPPVKSYPLYHGFFDLDELADRRQRQQGTHFSRQQRADVCKPESIHNKGLGIYQRFFDKCVILNENVRQEEDLPWRRLLKRVRNGTATQEDADSLNKLVWDPCDFEPRLCPEADEWARCKRFYPTVDQVLEEGSKRFNEAYKNAELTFDVTPVVTLNRACVRYSDVVSYGSEVKKVAHPLRLAVGAPVMVTTNLRGGRDWGIVNGSTGTVAGYITLDGGSVTYVLFKADAVLPGMPPLRLSVPGTTQVVELRDTWPIPVHTRKFHFKKTRSRMPAKIEIKYFPLSLAYALTVHKAQGMTEDHAIVDIVQKGHGRTGGQLAYVALSRVRTAAGLRLFRPVDLRSDVNRFALSVEREQLMTEFARLEQLQKNVLTERNLLEADSQNALSLEE